MGRIIGGVVAGYLVMFVCVVGLLFAAYFAMGTERAFQPGSNAPSTVWIVVMFVVGFVAAVIAGRVCAAIGKSPTAVNALVILVIVLGLLFAMPALTAKPSSEPRPGGLSNMDAMQKAQTPAWVALANPVVGVIGVLIGGRRKPARPAGF